MEKRTFGRGLKRLGLAGILGASLMFGSLGVRESYGQDANFMANRLEYEATWKGQSASDRRILRGAAYTYRQQANLDAEEAAKKAKWAIDEQNDLLRKIEQQQKDILANSGKNDNSSYQVASQAATYRNSSMTLEEAHRNLYKARLRGVFGQSDDDLRIIAVCNEWVDGYSGGEKDGKIDFPTEITGLDKEVFEKGEKITIMIIPGNKEREVIEYEAFKDNGEKLLDKDMLVMPNGLYRSVHFDRTNPEPGKYNLIFKLNQVKIKEVEFTIK
jgi:hypothetical protein